MLSTTLIEKTDRGRSRESQPMETSQKLQLIISALEDRKAVDVVTIDLEGKSLMADAIMVCSATSATHARAISDAVSQKLKGSGARPDHIESDPDSTWVVMDYGDVVLHIFQEEQRAYYDLEDLWKAPTGPRRKPEPENKGPLEPPDPNKPSRKGLYSRWNSQSFRSRKLSDR